MIRITIERLSIRKYTETTNLLLKATPTEFVEQESGGYSQNKKFATINEYQVVPVEKENLVTTTLLQQNMEQDENFDLKAVIKAINNLIP